MIACRLLGRVQTAKCSALAVNDERGREMTAEQGNQPEKPPIHFWIIGALGLLWNGFGGLDYTMTKTHNAAWMAMLTPEQIAYLDAFPLWANAAWALGVWGSVAGAVLLLLRKRHAVMAYIVSLVGLATSNFYQFSIASDETAAAFGPGVDPVTVAIWVILIGLWAHARWAKGRAWIS